MGAGLPGSGSGLPGALGRRLLSCCCLVCPGSRGPWGTQPRVGPGRLGQDGGPGRAGTLFAALSSRRDLCSWQEQPGSHAVVLWPPSPGLRRDRAARSAWSASRPLARGLTVFSGVSSSHRFLLTTLNGSPNSPPCSCPGGRAGWGWCSQHGADAGARADPADPWSVPLSCREAGWGGGRLWASGQADGREPDACSPGLAESPSSAPRACAAGRGGGSPGTACPSHPGEDVEGRCARGGQGQGGTGPETLSPPQQSAARPGDAPSL